MTIRRPRRFVPSPNDVRILGNGDELQSCSGQRVRACIRRNLDGEIAAPSFNRGAWNIQLYTVQTAFRAGLGGIKREECLCGDVLVGGGHGKGDLVGVTLHRRCGNQIVGVLFSDLPALQHVAITGDGGESNILAFVNGLLIPINGNCSAARVIYRGGHTGKLLGTQDCVEHIVAAFRQSKLCAAAILAERYLTFVNRSTIVGDCPLVQHISLWNRYDS